MSIQISAGGKQSGLCLEQVLATLPTMPGSTSQFNIHKQLVILYYVSS